MEHVRAVCLQQLLQPKGTCNKLSYFVGLEPQTPRGNGPDSLLLFCAFCLSILRPLKPEFVFRTENRILLSLTEETEEVSNISSNIYCQPLFSSASKTLEKYVLKPRSSLDSCCTGDSSEGHPSPVSQLLGWGAQSAVRPSRRLNGPTCAANFDF
jgi:hypothetical protein